ncbi:MAG: NUDIX hydrolase [Sedimentisphaerales bacterium]|nr:NUDIX hydrolase [Sedimentisphaerales bacterium]
MNEKGKYTYDWPRPMVSADALVFAVSGGKAKVLLIKRGHYPFEGQWALPGGYIGMEEDLEDTAVRELEEETGLTNVKLQQLAAFGTPGRDPRGRMITIVFWGITDKIHKVKGGDDAAQAKWFDIEKLPRPLAFDHEEVLALAIKNLKKKKIYRENVK